MTISWIGTQLREVHKFSDKSPNLFGNLVKEKDEDKVGFFRLLLAVIGLTYLNHKIASTF
jgi:hypothetical protein